MQNQFVTVKSFSNLADANLAKSLLESHDISVLLAGSAFAAVHSYPRALEDIRLQVPQQSADLATELLESEFTILPDPNLDEEDDERETSKVGKSRPNSSKRMIYILVVIVAIIGFIRVVLLKG